MHETHHAAQHEDHAARVNPNVLAQIWDGPLDALSVLRSEYRVFSMARLGLLGFKTPKPPKR